MRRTKEHAEQTRQNIIAAAFDIFLEEGFDSSSLEKICRAANVTRGAAYWHFKNKRDLYRHTVATVLEKMDKVREEIVQNPSLSQTDKLVELLWSPNHHTEIFSFVGQAVEFCKHNPSYSEIAAEVQQGEMRLYWHLLTELSTVDRPVCSAEELATMFYTMFLGMHAYSLGSSVKKPMSREMLRAFVESIVRPAADS